jgi:GNAT superfamily N-acetyltransferase
MRRRHSEASRGLFRDLNGDGATNRVTDCKAAAPLLLIGRLAIDNAFRGKGLGTDLLRDAMRRCLAAADIVGARGVLAHVIDDDAAGFYQHHGFVRSPLGERVMLMAIETVRALLE